MKKCIKCSLEKDESFFRKMWRAGGYIGYGNVCKKCVSSQTLKRRYSSEESYRKALESTAAYRVGREDELKIKSRKYREANKEKVLTYAKEYAAYYRKAFPHIVCSQSSKRRADKLQAVPKLSELDQEFNDLAVSEIYSLAKLRTQHTGFKWHVDHEVPLRSKIVCGLHYYKNLQVIPAKQNLLKSNKYWKDMP